MSEGRGVKGPQNSANLNHIETREEIAKLAGVSRDTVDKVKQIEKKATPEVKADLAKGKISINKAHQTTRAAKKEEEPAPLVVDGTADEAEKPPPPPQEDSAEERRRQIEYSRNQGPWTRDELRPEFYRITYCNRMG